MGASRRGQEHAVHPEEGSRYICRLLSGEGSRSMVRGEHKHGAF